MGLSLLTDAQEGTGFADSRDNSARFLTRKGTRGITVRTFCPFARQGRQWYGFGALQETVRSVRVAE